MTTDSLDADFRKEIARHILAYCMEIDETVARFDIPDLKAYSASHTPVQPTVMEYGQRPSA